MFNVCHFIQSVTIKKLSSWFKNRSQNIIFSVYDLSPAQTIIPNVWMSALPTIKLICFHRNSAYLIGKMVSFSLNGILCKLLMFKWNILFYLTIVIEHLIRHLKKKTNIYMESSPGTFGELLSLKKFSDHLTTDKYLKTDFIFYNME